MGGTCNTHGRDVKCVQSFGPKHLKGRGHLEDLRVRGRMIINWNFLREDVDWIHLARDRDHWGLL
jgi:hypothetical protein